MTTELQDAAKRPGHPAASAPPTGYEGADVGRVLRSAGVPVAPFATTSESTPGALQDAIRSRRALLLPGLAADWPALQRWTPELLASRLGTTEITALMDLPSSGTLFPRPQSEYERTMPLSDFVAHMQNTPPSAPCYLAYKRAEELFPDTEHDCAGVLGEFDSDPDTRAWLGSAGTRSMLHSDLKDNIFCQISGAKHVVLVPWVDSPAVYPFPDNVVNSRLDLAEPDLVRYPRLRGATVYAGMLTPGDVLYIPRGWWHDIRSCTPSVSLNHWFGPPLALRDYLPLMVRLGPQCWRATVSDFFRRGLLGRPEAVNFFFSPPSTGKRLFDAVRWGNFSHANDPTQDEEQPS